MPDMNRRKFLQGALAAAAAGILRPANALAAPQNGAEPQFVFGDGKPGGLPSEVQFVFPDSSKKPQVATFYVDAASMIGGNGVQPVSSLEREAIQLTRKNYSTPGAADNAFGIVWDPDVKEHVSLQEGPWRVDIHDYPNGYEIKPWTAILNGEYKLRTDGGIAAYNVLTHEELHLYYFGLDKLHKLLWLDMGDLTAATPPWAYGYMNIQKFGWQALYINHNGVKATVDQPHKRTEIDAAAPTDSVYDYIPNDPPAIRQAMNVALKAMDDAEMRADVMHRKFNPRGRESFRKMLNAAHPQ